jgi:hypothetical protein
MAIKLSRSMNAKEVARDMPPKETGILPGNFDRLIDGAAKIAMSPGQANRRRLLDAVDREKAK